MDESLFDEMELENYNELLKVIDPGQEIKFFTKVELNRSKILLAITDKYFVLYSSNSRFEDDSVIKFSRSFVKEIEYSQLQSKLMLVFDKDVVHLKIFSKHWKNRAQDIAAGYQHLQQTISEEVTFLEDLKVLEEVFGITDSLNSEIDLLGLDSDDLIEFENQIFNYSLSYRVGAYITGLYVILNLIPIAVDEVFSYHPNWVAVVFLPIFIVMLLRKNRAIRLPMIVFSFFGLFYFAKRLLDAGSYLNLYFDAVFAVSILFVLDGKPGKYRIIISGLFFSLLGFVVAIIVIVNDLFLT
ncbi:MAG: hypothetical protein ABFS17_04860 [Chloroflexota bacterium]